MRDLLLVGCGGFIGALLRLGVGRAAQRFGGEGFPWGTLCVNALGSLVAGVLMGVWAGERFEGHPGRLFLLTGVLGAFTTFSAFSYETLALARRDALPLAAGNVAANVVVSLLAVGLGFLAARGS